MKGIDSNGRVRLIMFIDSLLATVCDHEQVVTECLFPNLGIQCCK